jgi:nucleoside-triphosphatase THEP1
LLTEFFDLTTEKDTFRFCTITGYAGVGKSALARSTINYLTERNMLSGGVFYLNINRVKTYSDFLVEVNEQIINHPSQIFKQITDSLGG